MNTERDKFLAEAMGETYYEEVCDRPDCSCSEQVDLSTWTGFGKLWEWAQEQEWFEEFLDQQDVGEFIRVGDTTTCDIQGEFIHPDRFADAIYVYLKEKK